MFCLSSAFLAVAAGSGGPVVETLSPDPRVAFAAAEVRAALAARPAEVIVRLTLASDPAAAGLRPEGFALRVEAGQPPVISVAGADPAGLMYGGLEVAELLRTRGPAALEDGVHNARFALRGTKFNIPLDLRTPSYTDPCDAAQVNLPEVWSFDFWRDYLDSLARHRYNLVSLWNLHPFPSLVQVPGYERVALDDVWRSRRLSARERYPLIGTEFLNETLLADVEVVARLTITDKIDFWRRVMAHGRARNIDFYLITWNIFDYGTGGQYGLTDRADNPTTTDYFRRSVAQLFATYPDLAGIGLTTGENMPGLTPAQKEAWALATYGQGALDAVAAAPGRTIRFVHRQHMTRARDVAERFEPLVEHKAIDFLFSFKYAQAHVMSAVDQPFADGFVKELRELGQQTVWTLRNDSNYYFRWGGAGFVREFLNRLPADVTRGFYYGSDGYCWGRDFLQREVAGPRPLDIDRHWYHWLLWGRLGYDADLTDDRLIDLLAARFELPRPAAGRLFEAWQNASLVYPTITGSHWGALDFQWYPEACQSAPGFAENETGFHDVNRFISLPPHPRSGALSIPDYVKLTVAGETTPRLTPPRVAARLDELATLATAGLEGLAPTSDELAGTLADIAIMACLGRYYAAKIRGATALALFRETGVEAQRAEAIEHLRLAALAWRDYAERALARYRNPLWTNRVGLVDWRRTWRWCLDDIRLAGGEPTALGLPPELSVAAEGIDRRW